MNFKKLIFVNNECFLRNRRMTPAGIMLHSTGANNPELRRYVGPDDGLLGVNRFNNHWNQYRPDGRQVCVHGFIGKLKDGSIATYQTLPFNIECWGSGSGRNGSANRNYIQFEICEDGLRSKEYFEKVYNEAVEFVSMLCLEYNIPVDYPSIIDHQEGHKLGIAGNHGDIKHWFSRFGKTMDDFRNDVKKYINGNVIELVDLFIPYLVRIDVNLLNVRQAENASSKINTTVKKGQVFTIVDEKNGWGKLKSGAGWIKLSFTTKLKEV